MLLKQKLPQLVAHKTPYYLYDLSLLQNTLNALTTESKKYNYHVHYAFKANTNTKIIQQIKAAGLGADCVSGNEIKHAIDNGFEASKIVFAGVGKNDDEILYALQQNIFCFNCESIQELQVIDELAQ